VHRAPFTTSKHYLPRLLRGVAGNNNGNNTLSAQISGNKALKLSPFNPLFALIFLRMFCAWALKGPHTFN